MSTSDATSSDFDPEATPAGAPRMDVETTQQMIREMTTLTSALFSLLQPHRAPAPETSTPAAAPITPAAPAAPIVPSIPVDSVPVDSVPVDSVPVDSAPVDSAPATSIPLPSVATTTTETPDAPKPPAPAEVASIPLPSIPVPDLPNPEPVPEDEDQPSKDSRQSMALMNEIAFLDE